MLALAHLNVDGRVEGVLQELDQLRVVFLASGPRQVLGHVCEADLLQLHPGYDVHVQSAAVLKLEAHGVVVDVLEASGGHADASLHHELFDDGGHAVVHVQGHEELGVRESPRGLLVPLENAAVPGELPLGRRHGEEEVRHLLVLPADVLELGPFVLPEHGEVLHPGGHVLRSAFLLVCLHHDTADALR